jgi:AAHS family 4-hydroxybenzoate transporter-like MFS transporter
LTVLVIVSDGYDTQAIGYVVPALAQGWHIKVASFGPVFSAGTLGLAIGSILFPTIADRIGTRRVLLFCTAIYALLTLVTVWADSLEVLLVLRFLTGLGLGGAMPIGIALVSEYSPTRLRMTMVTGVVCGFALGGAIGGFVASAVIGPWGWQAVFVLGAVVPLVLVPIIAWVLPESLPRLMQSPPPHAALLAVTQRIVPDWRPADLRPQSQAPDRPQFSVRLLFAGGYAVPTVSIWIAYFSNLLLLYFLASWLPSMIHSAGMSMAAASLTTGFYQFGGVFGGLILAYACDKLHAKAVLACTFAISALFVFLIGASSADTAMLAFSVAGAGFCVIGGQGAINGFVGTFYPTAARATGSGWAVGIGRSGSIVGPLLGGWLIARGYSGESIFRLCAIPALVAMLAILAVRRPNPTVPTENMSIAAGLRL